MKFDPKRLAARLSRGNLIWAAGLVGVVLIGASTLFTGGGEAEPTAVASAGQEDFQAYADELEDRLAAMLSHLPGLQGCEVLVTMQQGVENVYATEQKTAADASETSEVSRASSGSRTSGEQTVIMVQTESGEQPLLLTRLAPRVKGVVVFVPGAVAPETAQTVTAALATALDLEAGQICVVTGTQTRKD